MQLHPTVTTTEAPADRSSTAELAPAPGNVRLRRRLIWSGTVGLLVLSLILLPPLLNANRYQRQIARSMSASLGRPVHLDNATLHLLPVPGLTLTNLVVSEDPAFGDEPTIRANTVEATLRLGSLWRRRVEFSTVRFVEPSVNLVRNPQGRWNLADVLLHASHVETAPTAQAHAGPAPRFPYIEATGGRVNLKLGAEKLPFSLTDADFALWLPSPNQWKVRLQGQPARTDTNLNDPGILRLEGGLQRAETATGIPVDLHASWHEAPLGEASRLVSGEDMGWRGTLNVDATLAGTLSDATFGSKVTLGDVRRAEFAAVHPLSLQIACGAQISAASARLSGLRCTMPDSAPHAMELQSAGVDLNHPAQAPVTLDAEDVPLHWGLLWAALFSVRVPTDLYPEARVEVHLRHLVPGNVRGLTVAPALHKAGRGRAHTAAPRRMPALAMATAWTGEVRVHLPPPPTVNPSAARPVAASTSGINLVWHPAGPPRMGQSSQMLAPSGHGLGFVMDPISIPLTPGTNLTVTAAIGPMGYTVAASGVASTAALLLPARYLPQLGDGLSAIVPAAPTDLESARVDFTCTHPWGALQTCTSLRPTAVSGRSFPLPSATLPQGIVPIQLAPRSLSPFDRDPQLGGPPQDRPYGETAPPPSAYAPRTRPRQGTPASAPRP